MSAVTAEVLRRLHSAGTPPRVINLAARSLERSLLARLRRMVVVIPGLLRYGLNLRLPAGSAVYIGVSSGFGQLYDLLFVAAARLRRHRIFLHYHAYSYIDRPSRTTAMLTHLAGRGACHVLLSEGMAAKFIVRYPAVRRSLVVSNAALIPAAALPAQAPVRQQLRRIGFLGNICVEKGVFEFLEVAAAAVEVGLQIEAVLAGPFQDKGVKQRVEQRLQASHNLSYVGPQYGSDKDRYLRSLDVLIFPTSYVVEAQPLTILEAMMHGVPAIAYGRGSIAEMIGTAGLVIEPGADFVAPAVTQLREWHVRSDKLEQASIAARQRFDRLRQESWDEWAALMRWLQGVGP